jgi:hypothetical protein
MGISEDITEYKRTDEALNLARQKLSLLNAVTFEDIQAASFSLIAYHELMKTVVLDEKGKAYLEKQGAANQKILDSLDFAKNYQNLGMQNPRWQDSVRSSYLPSRTWISCIFTISAGWKGFRSMPIRCWRKPCFTLRRTCLNTVFTRQK